MRDKVLGQRGGTAAGGRVIIALADPLLREPLAMALAESGFRILEFTEATAALDHIEAGADVEAIVVEAEREAPQDGLGADPRARLRAARCASPVFVLNGPAENGEAGELRAAAERWGALGILDRTQPLAGLAGSLVKAIRASALLAEPKSLPARRRGPLMFDAEGERVSWKGAHLDLDRSEQALLAALIAAPESGLTHQRMQAVLTDAGLRAGDGLPEGGIQEGGAADGDPERVKALVRRLRKKFREVDPDFDRIVFVPGSGYGWRDREASGTDLDESPE